MKCPDTVVGTRVSASGVIPRKLLMKIWLLAGRRVVKKVDPAQPRKDEPTLRSGAP